MGQVLFIDSERPDPDAVNAAVEVINRGGVVLSPTDTVSGLACDPNRAEAVERIREIKRRSADKGFLLLIPGPYWVGRLATVIPKDFQQLKQFWPGPVTFLFAAGPQAPWAAVSSEQRIGLRCPEDAFLQSWLKTLGRPLLSTSANRSGEEAPATIVQLRKMFEGCVDLLLLGCDEIGSRASTVVDVTVSPPEIVRRGDWSERVEKVVGVEP